MSRAISACGVRRYGVARVCDEWQLPRSTLYASRERSERSRVPAKRGPKTRYTDVELTPHIRRVIEESPFLVSAPMLIVP